MNFDEKVRSLVDTLDKRCKGIEALAEREIQEVQDHRYYAICDAEADYQKAVTAVINEQRAKDDARKNGKYPDPISNDILDEARDKLHELIDLILPSRDLPPM